MAHHVEDLVNVGVRLHMHVVLQLLEGVRGTVSLWHFDGHLCSRAVIPCAKYLSESSLMQHAALQRVGP